MQNTRGNSRISNTYTICTYKRSTTSQGRTKSPIPFPKCIRKKNFNLSYFTFSNFL